MAASYKKLWKLLIDKDLKKKDLNQGKSTYVDLIAVVVFRMTV